MSMDKNDGYDTIRAAYRRGALDTLNRITNADHRENPEETLEKYIDGLKARPLVARLNG